MLDYAEDEFCRELSDTAVVTNLARSEAIDILSGDDI